MMSAARDAIQTVAPVASRKTKRDSPRWLARPGFLRVAKIGLVIAGILAVPGSTHGQDRVESSERSANDRLTSALRYYLHGDLRSSLAEARRQLARHPDDFLSLRLRNYLSSTSARQQDRLEEPLDPRLARELSRQSIKSYLQGDDVSAESLARRALTLDPGRLELPHILRLIDARDHRESDDLYERLFAGRQTQQVTGELRSAPLGAAIDAFLRHSSQSVLVEGVQGNEVSVRFSRLSPARAFQSLLSSAGFSLEKERDGELAVRPIDENHRRTRVFRLQNIVLSGTGDASGGGGEDEGPGGLTAPSQEAIENDPTLAAIRSVISDEGALQYDPSRRSLVVTDFPERLEAVDEVIRELDRPASQIFIHARVVEIADSDLREIGVDWDLDYGLNISSMTRPTTFPFFSGHDFLKDVRPKTDPTDEEFPSGPIETTDDLFPFARTGDFSFGTVAAGTLGVEILLNEVLGRSEVLSSPRVVALEGTLAEIQVGERIPIPTLSTDSETGNVNVTGFEEERVGILLQVVPYILGDDLIRLSVHPEVSAVTGFVGDENQRPIVSTREVTTEVIVRSGSTFVIGGLIRDSEIKTTQKIPWISDIPILGKLFQQRSADGSKTELVIFITVEVVSPSRIATEREMDFYNLRRRSSLEDR